MKPADKTNAMRIFDRLKIPYKHYTYESDGAISGVEVAKLLNQDPAHVFKTLVTVGKTGKNYVFMIPVAEELNLKKAAIHAGEKSIEMLKSKDLLSTVGYIHGGCSPVGMKKLLPTFIDSKAEKYPTIIFSAGKIGQQLECSILDLSKAIPWKLYHSQ